MNLEFFDWNTPLLPAAAERIISKYILESSIDCRELTICVPGARAGRRLLELLVFCAEERKAPLFSPRIVTVGAVPELFYTSAHPAASALERALAWTEAFKRATPEAQQAVSGLWNPTHSLRAKHSFGTYLDGIYQEFAAAQKSFKDAAKLCLEDADTYSDKRWSHLDGLWQNFLTILEEQELSDIHSERRRALSAYTSHFRGELLLVGCIDLPQIVRDFISQFATAATTFIFAPTSKSQGFDEFGCIKHTFWHSDLIPISEAQLHIAQSPSGQADALLIALSQSKAPAADELSIGLGDESLLPFVTERLEKLEYRSHFSSGQPFSNSSLYKLLITIEAYLLSGKVSDLLALIRHPDILEHLSVKLGSDSTALLKAFDEYQTAHLQYSARSALFASQGLVSESFACLEALFQPFLHPEFSLNATYQHCAKLALELCKLGPEDSTFALLLSSIEQLCTSAATSKVCASNFEALSLLLLQLQKVRIADDPSDHMHSVEVLGWLELALDDAPNLVVLGVNEGSLPELISADAFLPDALRSKIGLLDNQKRLARDLFTLATLTRSKEALHLICGRSSLSGEPLRPSPILFACEALEAATRIQLFYSAQETKLLNPLPPGDKATAFPSPVPLQPQTKLQISVTGFATYLDCPYRYYLKHVLKLREVHDKEHELNAMSFGSLLHRFLQDFAQSDVADSVTETLIKDFLLSTLDTFFSRHFGANCLPAVLLQRKQLERRLGTFAKMQAEHRAEGWRITHSELAWPTDAQILALDDGTPVLITGRIDRIDTHEQSGALYVLDYKTGDKKADPAKRHKNNQRWFDLQLPLYRALALALNPQTQVQVGYFGLGSTDETSAFISLDWEESVFVEALSVAKSVAQKIKDGIFWPPAEDSKDSNFKLINEDALWQPR
jgi:inactivated superfamily I helicase